MKVFIDEEAREEYILYQMYKDKNKIINKDNNDYNGNSQEEDKSKK